MKILLIEDDESVAAALEKILGEQHYRVDIAADGQAGWKFVEAFTYDLILLDIVLPKLSGIQFCQRLRAKKYHTPVLLLTAQSSSTDKVIGFDAGADDYVVKPFEPIELLARIRALLRRRDFPEKKLLEWLYLRLDPDICEVTYNGQVLHLTPKEYRLLELFLRNHHRVFSRSAILDHLWDYEEAPQEDTVTVHIKALRQKLKQAGAPGNLIETVYGQGYRLKQIKSPSLELTDPQVPETAIQQQTRDRLAIVWEKYRGLSCDRLNVLENATTAWLASKLDDEQRQKAYQAAHKLAGALGIFGFAEGSHHAREIEDIFQAGGDLDQSRSGHLAARLRLLQALLDQSALGRQRFPENLLSPGDLQTRLQSDATVVESNRCVSNRQPAVNAPSWTGSCHPLVLVVDDDIELAEQIFQLATALAMSVKLAPTPAAMSQTISTQRLDLVLLNLSLTKANEANLQPLLDLANQTPPLPVLFLSHPDNLLHWVKLNRLTTHAFLQKTLHPKQILDAVMQVRLQLKATLAKVMLVDDDLQVLAGMRTLLEPLGLQLITLAEPLQFWQTLENCAPDLLILDVRMPDLNGIDLCQVLRHCPQWNQLPVLFLTGYMDSSLMNQVFRVGADGCLSKAIAAPELVTRIISHLEQVRLLRGVTEFVNCLPTQAIVSATGVSEEHRTVA